jgi:ABC-type dipeptide/oligopeptide/nickel transport system permease component
MTLVAFVVAIVIALLTGLTVGVVTARDNSTVLRQVARSREVSVLEAWREHR